MNDRFGRTVVVKGAFLLLTLAAVWILPPVVHKARQQCPLRPDAAPEAQALPAFSRKYKISCAQCHSGFPVLNAYGRQFKMNGFVRERDGSEGVLKSQDDQLVTESIVPWAMIIRSRPLDNGKGSISSQGTQMGGTAEPNPNGFQFQPLNDVDGFIAGGNAAKHVSFFGELDANQAGGFSPSFGDIRLGYHPFAALNVIAARRGFFADDPYQTIVSNESPTIANRATDMLMQGQNSITGNTLLMTQQMLAVSGQADLTGDSFLYYAAGATKDSDGGSQWSSPTGGNLRLALDSGKGVMIGTFGSYGHARPSAVGGSGGGLGVDMGTGELQDFERFGFDALWEKGDFAARGAFVYARDHDGAAVAADTNRAAYAELAYYYKRGGAAYPCLVPLIRENWYSTYNGSQKFNYVTTQLAHYFAPNVKGFVEYSFDTARALQGSTTQDPTQGTLAIRGNRTTLQLEVGF